MHKNTFLPVAALHLQQQWPDTSHRGFHDCSMFQGHHKSPGKQKCIKVISINLRFFLLASSINGLVIKALDFQSRGLVFKTTGGSKDDSICHPSKVDKMSTRNFWELNGKKLPPQSGSVALRQLAPSIKKGHNVFLCIFLLNLLI